jgi:SAM-dependent methyltransferase
VTFSLDWDLFYTDRGISGGRYANYEKLVFMFVSEAERMLELGAGAGAEIPFFHEAGFGYHGIEGSEEVVRAARANCPKLADRIFHGDFTKALPVGDLDLIAERASVPHNDLASIRRCLGMAFDALKPGGIYISSDWFSSNHSEAMRGKRAGDGTRYGYEDGQFAGVGKVRFSDLAELTDLFGRFEGIFVQERIARRPGPGPLVERPVSVHWISDRFRRQPYQAAWWDLVMRKPR